MRRRKSPSRDEARSSISERVASFGTPPSLKDVKDIDMVTGRKELSSSLRKSGLLDSVRAGASSPRLARSLFAEEESK